MEEGFVIISMNIICFTSRKDSVVLDQVKNGHDQKGMVHHTWHLVVSRYKLVRRSKTVDMYD